MQGLFYWHFYEASNRPSHGIKLRWLVQSISCPRGPTEASAPTSPMATHITDSSNFPLSAFKLTLARTCLGDKRTVPLSLVIFFKYSGAGYKRKKGD